MAAAAVQRRGQQHYDRYWPTFRLHMTPLDDAGGEVCSRGKLEHAQHQFAVRISALIDASHLPIGLGGGHEMAFAGYLAYRHRQPCAWPPYSPGWVPACPSTTA
jgi:arginase family enzyme